MRSLLILVFTISTVVFGCMSAQAGWYDSRFLKGGKGYKLERDDAIVLVFTHGSKGDQKRDPCIFTLGSHLLDQYFGSFRMPRAFEALANDDPRIALFYVCHREIGDKGALKKETYKNIPCSNTKTTGSAKFCKRKQKIAFEVSEIKRYNPRLPNSRIFLSGASSGAWTSMLLESGKKSVANGVIAFAPATNGKLGKKVLKAGGKTKTIKEKCGPYPNRYTKIPNLEKPKPYLRHQCQQKYMAKNIRSALVYSFEGDPFNPPKLLPSFKKARKIKLKPVARSLCGLSLPFSSHPHSCFQKKSFTNEYLDEIRQYMNDRLAK